MQKIFNSGFSYLLAGKLMRVQYPNQIMTTTVMEELPEFAECFQQYGFNQMMREPRRYSKVLIHEFYIANKEELQRQYPKGMLWKGGELITSIMIHGIWVDISAQTIERFLYALKYQAPANTGEIDYMVEEMIKNH